MYPIITLAKNIALSNVSDLQIPYRMTYALTYRCQFQCRMCNIWRKNPSEELSLNQITKFFKQSGGLSWINLTGGEIFMRADLLDIINAINTHCRSVYLLNFPSNGYLTGTIVKTVAKILSSFSFPKLAVTISLDGPPELHDLIRNMPGSWDRAVNTFQQLQRLKSPRFNVYFGMTLQDANAQTFEDTVRAVSEKIGEGHYNRFHVNISHTSHHYYGNADCSGLSDKQLIMDQLNRIGKRLNGSFLSPVNFLESQYRKRVSSFLSEGRTPVPCQALSSSFFMDPTGAVYPCTIFDKPVGKIQDFEYNIDHLWKSEQRRDSRQNIRKGNCPQCWTPCEAYQSILANLLPFRARQ